MQYLTIIRLKTDGNLLQGGGDNVKKSGHSTAVTFFTFLALLTVIGSFVCWDTQAEAVDKKKTKPAPVTMKVILERKYLDGEISQETFEETVISFEDFWKKYSGWQLVDLDFNKVVFREEVDDISPLLKANGYFGIAADGTLSIFNGKPDEANVIQSFYQLDVGKLESAKHAELKKGIPVRNKEQFVKVLETFKTYQ